MRILLVAVTAWLLPGAAEAQPARAWSTYAEIDAIYAQFDAVPADKREHIGFALYVSPTREVPVSDVVFTMGEGTDAVVFGADERNHLAFPRSAASPHTNTKILINQPSDVLIWLSIVGTYEGAEDGVATGGELNAFRKRFSKALKSQAGAMALFMPSAKGVAVRGADGDAVSIVSDGVTERRPFPEGTRRLVLTKAELRDLDEVRLTDGQWFEVHYESHVSYLTDVDAANRD